MYNLQDVLKLASGNWSSIFCDLSKTDLSEQLKAGSNNCTCPVHQGSGSFSFFRDWETTGGGHCFACHGDGKTPTNGIYFLMWINKWEFKEALDAVGEWVHADKKGFKKKSVKSAPAPQPKKLVLNELQKEKNLILWREAIPVTYSKAQLLRDYLELRGLRIDRIPEVIRFHPAQEYRVFSNDGKESELLGVWPCMVAPVRRLDGAFVGVHRTYLDPETANKVVLRDGLSPKKLTPSVYKGCYRGASIRFNPIDSHIVGISEGIETALAVTQIMPIDFMVGISAHYLPKLEFPPNVRQVKIFMDRDKSKMLNNKEVGRAGQLRALQLSERLADMGISSALYMPPGEIVGKSRDWLDAYKENGMRDMPVKREDRVVLDTLDAHTKTS